MVRMPPAMLQNSVEAIQEIHKTSSVGANKPYTPQAATSSVGACVSNGFKNRKFSVGDNKTYTKGAFAIVRTPPTMLRHSAEAMPEIKDTSSGGDNKPYTPQAATSSVGPVFPMISSIG
eukprot:9554075-Karenia_brevis.AAC.1